MTKVLGHSAPTPRRSQGGEHLDNRKTCSLQPDEMIKAGTHAGLIGLILIKLGGVCGGKEGRNEKVKSTERILTFAVEREERYI